MMHPQPLPKLNCGIEKKEKEVKKEKRRN